MSLLRFFFLSLACNLEYICSASSPKFRQYRPSMFPLSTSRSAAMDYFPFYWWTEDDNDIVVATYSHRPLIESAQVSLSPTNTNYFNCISHGVSVTTWNRSKFQMPKSSAKSIRLDELAIMLLTFRKNSLKSHKKLDKGFRGCLARNPTP